MTPRPPLDELLALFRATVAAEGITTGAGTAAGDNFIDAALAGAGDNSFVSMLAILYPGQPLLVDSKDITAFNDVTGAVTLAGAYKETPGAIPAGVPYKIVTFRFVPAEVAALAALVTALATDIEGATGIFHEQADDGFTEEIVADETFIVTLNVADTRYILRDLRVKCEDPTAANTVTITLYTLINGGETAVDTFVITNANFGTHHSLMDMFGVPYVAGDSIRVSATGSAAGPYTLDGQYSHGKTNI